jgi:hypothetical protein
MEKRNLFRDLLNRLELNPNDPNVSDAIISEIQRNQSSPKLNDLLSDLNRLRLDAKPYPDLMFIDKIVTDSNNALKEMNEEHLYIKWVETKQYGNTWLKGKEPIVLKTNNYALRYSFKMCEMKKFVRKNDKIVFSIDLYTHPSSKDSIIRLRVRNENHTNPYIENQESENIRYLGENHLLDSISILMQNLIYCNATKSLNRDLVTQYEEPASEYIRQDDPEDTEMEDNDDYLLDQLGR